MFTGIVTEVGRVERVERASGMRVRIAAPIDASAAGASIACDGVCLTVADGADGWFEADVSARNGVEDRAWLLGTGARRQS